MNAVALIASLVLGSSSVALAAPSATVSVSARASYGTQVVRDHRSPRVIAADHHAEDCTPTSIESPPIVRPGWHPGWEGGRPLPQVYRPVTLASGLSFAGRGRTFITVGSQAGRFGTLTIDAAGGRTFIKQVYVEFDNGQEQVMRNLDRTLTGAEQLTLDLDGGRRAIRRVVVYGTDLNTGFAPSPRAFSVIAS